MKHRGLKGTVERSCYETAWKGRLILDESDITYRAKTLGSLHDQFVKKVDSYLNKYEKNDDSFNWHGLPGSLNPPQKKCSVDEPPKKESILATAGRIINGERQDSYGAPEDSFQIIAEYWSAYLNGKFKTRTPGFKFVLVPVDVANLQILFKQARKLGQKPKRDNYVDSVGYEAIAADRLSIWED